MCKWAELAHQTMVSHANALGPMPVPSSELLRFHPSLVSGSSAAPHLPWAANISGPSVSWRQGRTYQHFPFPTSWVDILQQTTQKNRLQFTHRATAHFAELCGAHSPSMPIWGRLQTGRQRQELSARFCFASVRRVNVAFMKAHRKVSHKSLLQNLVQKEPRP